MKDDLFVSFSVFKKDSDDLLAEPTVNVNPARHGMTLNLAILRELDIVMEQYPADLHDYQVRITHSPVPDDHLEKSET
jgi:hypothetical protein